MAKLEMVGLTPEDGEGPGRVVRRHDQACGAGTGLGARSGDLPGRADIGARSDCRREFDALIRTLQETLRLTVFMVTHDLASVAGVCDRVRPCGRKDRRHRIHGGGARLFTSLGASVFRRRARPRAPATFDRVDELAMETRARFILVGLFAVAVIAAGFLFVYWLNNTGVSARGLPTGCASRVPSRVCGPAPPSCSMGSASAR